MSKRSEKSFHKRHVNGKSTALISRKCKFRHMRDDCTLTRVAEITD